MLRRAVTGLALAASIAAGSLALPASTPLAEAAGNAPTVGSQFHGMWSNYTDAERAQALDTLAANGVQSVRLDVSWAMLQPDGPGRYSDWGVGFVDRVLTMIADRGMEPLVMLWMTPAWANGGKDERTLPDDPQAYAEAARWAASRWAGTVSAWEVWNEPNADAFMRGEDPVAYAQLLRAAYPAIKAGNPSAKVVFGGTMYNDVDWIRKALEAGAAGSYDVMATHPYMAIADAPPELQDGTKWTLRYARAVYDLMVATGDGDKPIWFTEFGWSSHPNTGSEANWQRGVTPQQQADYLVRTLRLVQAEMPFVTNVFWYNERDRTDGDVQLNNYGLMTSDLRPKPVLLALKAYRGALPAPSAPAAPPAPAPAPAPAPTPPPGAVLPVAVIDCPAVNPAQVAAAAVLCAPETLGR